MKYRYLSTGFIAITFKCTIDLFVCFEFIRPFLVLIASSHHTFYANKFTQDNGRAGTPSFVMVTGRMEPSLSNSILSMQTFRSLAASSPSGRRWYTMYHSSVPGTLRIPLLPVPWATFASGERMWVDASLKGPRGLVVDVTYSTP